VKGFSFPPTERIQGNGLKWFTEDQDFITTVYGWTSVAVVIAVVLWLFGRSAIDLAKSIFTGVYQVSYRHEYISLFGLAAACLHHLTSSTL
jgi:hypothetical protein